MLIIIFPKNFEENMKISIPESVDFASLKKGAA
jgi:hypothetical protein